MSSYLQLRIILTNEIRKAEKVQFLLSSRHLILASPVFGTMLSGGWKESAVLDERPRKIARLENKDTSDSELQVRHEITASEWNTEVLLHLMNIIHGHHKKVPTLVDLDTFVQFSILVDYYKCHEITDVFARFWISKLKINLSAPQVEIILPWIFVSWVFSKTTIFEQMTELAIKGSEGPLEAMGLPLPPAILGMRPWHIRSRQELTYDTAAIEEKRTSSLQMILRTVDEFREGLVKGSQGCGFECSSMLLGALVKQMDKHKIGQHLLLEPCSGRSIRQVKLILLEFNTPTWYLIRPHAWNPEEHTCSLKAKLKPLLGGVWETIKGLKLDDYRVQQKDEAAKV